MEPITFTQKCNAMQNNPIQTMLDEHEVISEAIKQVDKLENTWESDPEGYTAKIKWLIQFFREYADDYHHRKEEDILFPAIKNNPDFVLGEMIDEFTQHHDNFREYGRDILQNLEEENFPTSFKYLKQYCDDLRDHIAAENDELFVLAENLLSEEELEKIFFQFKDIHMDLGKIRKAEMEQKVYDMRG